MAASGAMKGEHILVADEKEANVIYNKGAFGTPQTGGALLLDHDEALYLVENNRLSVVGVDAGELLRKASAAESGFEIRYIVYRDLRARGFTVRRSNVIDYNVFDRGSLPGRAKAKYLVRCVSERDTLIAPSVAEDVRRAEGLEKQLLLALVDEEGDLTYYETRLRDLSAAVPALPESKATAHLLDDRVVVLDPKGVLSLRTGGFFGRDIGIGLQLSLPESVYLAEEGFLDVFDAPGKQRITPAALVARARTLEPEFDLRQALYRSLRGNGVVVKTGFKYGTHYRAYIGAPDEEHAPYLVHALQPERAVPWPEVAGFVRLAHGVRKRLFFATVSARGGFDLLELARRKP